MEMPQVSINTDLSDGLCFGCGGNNPIGLQLKFRKDGSGVRAEFLPDARYQGWPGILHGGIIGCLLDEGVSYAAHFAGVKCLTAKMEMRLRRPASIEEPLIITGRVTRHTRRLLQSEARLLLHDGTVIAEGTATQFVVANQDAGTRELSDTDA